MNYWFGYRFLDIAESAKHGRWVAEGPCASREEADEKRRDANSASDAEVTQVFSALSEKEAMDYISSKF